MRPGPIIYGPRGEQVDDLRGSLLDDNETLANARLISCAPEMLEKLELIYSCAAESPEWIRARLESIIARAKGEEV